MTAPAPDDGRPFRRIATRELCKLITYAAEIGLCPETVAAARAELWHRRRLAARRWRRW